MIDSAYVLIASGAAIGFGLGYLAGIWRARCKIAVRLNSLHSANALAYFLRKEQVRHMMDLRNLQKDIDRLKRLGVEIPDNIPLETWVKVPLWETFA